MERNEEFNHGTSQEAENEEEEDEDTKAMKRKIIMQARQDELMKRGERNDLFNCIMMERYKAEQKACFLREQEARELKTLHEQHEQKLGEELLRRKNEDLLEQKRRQLLRNESIELRRLEDQLRNSYAGKAAKMQLFEREICRKNAKFREIEDARKIQCWYQNDSFEKQQMLETRQKKEQYRRDLQDQLVLNDGLRQQKKDEKRRERKLVEEAREVLRVEDLENQRSKRETAARLFAEERAFFEAREFWKFKEKQRLLKENDECGRILADKMDEQSPSKDAKVAAAAAKQAMLEKMTIKMLEVEDKKRELENIANKLVAEEERNKLEKRERNDAMKKSVTAKGLLDDMRRQKLMLEERKAREDEADREFADYLDRERDKSVLADKKKAEERRARGIEYGNALKEAITRKSIGYTMEILENQTMLKLNRKLYDARQISVEEERSRMFEEHERRLQVFTKPGTVLCESPVSTNKAPSPSSY